MVIHPAPPTQRGSVRNVTIEGDPNTYMCEVRTSPASGLRSGNRCWIEFGAVWADVNGEKLRVPGQWRECELLPGPAGTSADVHVRILPLSAMRQRLEPPTSCCDEGWVCEDHPDRPMGHGCGGAGMPCEASSCPWRRQ